MNYLSSLQSLVIALMWCGVAQAPSFSTDLTVKLENRLTIKHCFIAASCVLFDMVSVSTIISLFFHLQVAETFKISRGPWLLMKVTIVNFEQLIFDLLRKESFNEWCN